MHQLPSPSLVFKIFGLPLLMGGIFAAVAAEEVIIDADFTQVLDGPVDLVDFAVPDSEGIFSAPTGVQVGETSSARVMPSERDPSQYEAKFDVGPRDAGSDSPGNITIDWDLRDLVLDSGKFELQYEVTILSEPVSGARLWITFANAAGGRIQTATSIHPSQRVMVSVREGAEVRARGRNIQGSYEFPMQITILLDMDLHHWSVSVDGQVLLADDPFPEALLEADPRPILGRIFFGSQAGFGDKAPLQYSLSKLRLVRLSN